MSRVIGRLPSTLRDKDESENGNGVESVFTDEAISVYPCFNIFSTKSVRLSVSRNSAKLKLIDLNGYKEKESHCVPIRRKDDRIKENPFLKYRVPDEVVDVIFSNLRKRDLLAAMQVCKQFYAVGHQSKGWSITDLMERPITELTLTTLMKRKIRVLRLAGVKFDSSSSVDVRIFSSFMFSSSRLEFLDLSRSNLSHQNLSIILKPCRKLQCLSIEGGILNDEVAIYISENKNLRELDVSMTRGITSTGAKLIFTSCKKLEQFNASWCGLTRPILDAIFENISNTIRKLNIAGSVRNHGLNDEHIEVLSIKAENMVDIDLSDNVELGDACVATLISRFTKLTCISLNRCYAIDPNVIVHLNIKPSLKFLNVHGCITESNMELFLQMCGRLKINNHLFNFTAKPVSNNYSWIWGNDMRELL